MNERFLLSGILCEVRQCGVCGVIHALPAAIVDHYRKAGGFWTCPNGHRWGFKEGQAARDELRTERDRLKQDIARAEDERAAALAAQQLAERRLTQYKKRAAAGTCPCCKRTFSNMARHMKTEHPTYNVMPLKAERVA